MPSKIPTVTKSSTSTEAQLLPSASLPESIPTTSNSEHSNAPEIPQCVKRNSRNRRKPPKVQKPEIEIEMAPHRPRKSAPTEYATDEEDMITYDVWRSRNLNQILRSIREYRNCLFDATRRYCQTERSRVVDSLMAGYRHQLSSDSCVRVYDSECSAGHQSAASFVLLVTCLALLSALVSFRR
ncbi:uncharacterized protein TNCV_832451 [Trichonephila clavipes]|nr:uncharacterized protein TNCV_832451 [Trichonephila clavipes]